MQHQLGRLFKFFISTFELTLNHSCKNVPNGDITGFSAFLCFNCVSVTGHLWKSEGLDELGEMERQRSSVSIHL